MLAVLRAGRDDDWFAPLAHHLGHGDPDAGEESRPGRWMATSERIARLLLGYVRERPDMLRAWTLGDDLDPLGTSLPATSLWQPAIWRACRANLPFCDDPVSRHDRLLADPAAAFAAIPPEGLLVVDPGPMGAFEHEFLDGLARARPVTVFTPTPAGPATAWGHRLGTSARAQHDRFVSGGATVQSVRDPARRPRPDSVLHRLQADLVAAERRATPLVPHAPDGSVQVHASHGPDRQVEVLRDVLCGLFADHPDLEPRDVVVACPRLDVFAPLVRAAFGGPGRSTPAMTTGPSNRSGIRARGCVSRWPPARSKTPTRHSPCCGCC